MIVLPGAGIVEQAEPQTRLGQHPLVHRDPAGAAADPPWQLISVAKAGLNGGRS